MVLASEGRIAGQQQEEEDSQRPIVAFLVVELPDDFGGEIAGSADAVEIGGAFGVELIGAAEVDNFENLGLLIVDDVFEFDVSVHDVVGVEVVEG